MTDRGVYHLDLAYPEHKVGIEMLGFGPHGNRRAFDRDPLRRNELQNDGWIVLEFTSRTPVAVLLGQVADGRSRRDVEMPVEKRPISRRHRKKRVPAV